MKIKYKKNVTCWVDNLIILKCMRNRKTAGDLSKKTR